MIEITAKQLYDIYSHLPTTGDALRNDIDGIYRCVLQPNPSLLRMTIENGDIFDMEDSKIIEFKVDTNSYPFEWKPTTDLIIKA